MSALATEPGVKDWLIELLNALEYGLYPPDCGACNSGLTGRCPVHAKAEEAARAATETVALVQQADSDDEARRVFTAAIASLAGGTRYAVASGTITAGGAR
jgi:hypothetical protein